MATSSVAILRLLLREAAARGIAARELLGDGPAIELDDPDARYPRELEHRVWRAIVARTGHDFGLELAQSVALHGEFGLLEYVLRAARTFGDFIRRIERYLPILFDGDPVVLETVGDELRLGYYRGVDAPPVFGPPSECAVGTFVLMVRKLVGEAFAPRTVYFQHEAPASTRLHDQIFRAPIVFGAGMNGVALDARALDIPIPGDPRLDEILHAAAERVLAQLPQTSPFTQRVRRAMLAAAGSEADLAQIAKRLGTSDRTLQRRLQEEGWTFQKLFDDVRRSLAETYLKDNARSVSEIAFALGFAEPNAFSRAFRRWSGESPQEFRKRVTKS